VPVAAQDLSNVLKQGNLEKRKRGTGALEDVEEEEEEQGVEEEEEEGVEEEEDGEEEESHPSHSDPMRSSYLFI